MHDPKVNKQTSYDALKEEQYPYLKAYCTQNPPQSQKDEANDLATELRSGRYIKKYCFRYPSTFFLLIAAILTILAWTTNLSFSWPLGFVLLGFVLHQLSEHIPFDHKQEVELWEKIERLRRPIPLTTFSDTHFYPVGNIKIRVTIVYETSRPLPPRPLIWDDPFVKALSHKIPLVIQRYFDYIVDTRSLTGESAEDEVRTDLWLSDHLEHALLPRVCQTCHDFQPSVFRYCVQTNISQEENPDTSLPIGDAYPLDPPQH